MFIVPTERYRIYASMVFVVLTLGVGLPLWWETTAVPRVKLPYAGIRNLDELGMHMSLKLYLGCLEESSCADKAVELLAKLTDLGQLGEYLRHFFFFCALAENIVNTLDDGRDRGTNCGVIYDLPRLIRFF